MDDDRYGTGHDRQEEKVRELLGLLHEDVRAPAALREAVLREIAKPRTSRTERVIEWVLRPRLVPVSPAVAGLAAVAVAILILLRPPASSVVLPPVNADGGIEQIVTRFVLVAPGAASVHVTGDFNSWSREGIALEDLRGSGIWTGDIALPPGVHQYTFVVNGTEWVPDPSAALQVDDGFGQLNSILVVPEEGEV